MAICIDPKLVDKIKSLDLPNMGTIQRIKVISDILGDETGRNINNIYEKTLLLKNRDKAFKRFIDDISGVSVQKKEVLKKNIAERLARKQGIIEDKELLSIVKETLDRKYDLNIPDEIVQRLLNVKKEADKLAIPAKGTVDGSPEKLKWGEKVVEYSDMIGELKDSMSGDLLTALKKEGLDAISRIKESKGALGKTGQTINETMSAILGIPAKGIKAAWDASYLFRQGLKLLTADPKIWARQGKQSLGAWTNVFNKDLMDDMVRAWKADIVTRDLYQDAIKSKLAIGVVEDFFPTNIAEKIPGIGNLFKASDKSFTMFSQGARMDLFEKYVKQLTEDAGGVKPSKEVMDNLANYVNGLTGRGGLGKAEAVSNLLNHIFFSARYQVANIKTFSDALFSPTPEISKLAAKNLAKHIVVIAGLMTTLSAITDVGFDPGETTFGKARIPGTKKWVDVTGGLASYISLISRMYNKVSGGKPAYGETSAWGMFGDFLSGKLAPVPGVGRDLLEQKTFEGKHPDFSSVMRGLFVPITADNVWKSVEKQEEESILALQAIFEIVGFGVSQPKAKSEGSYPSPFR